jgi:hypothetical protein
MKLLYSRKFQLVLADSAFGLAALCLAFFVKDADWQRFLAGIFAIIQPVIVAAILGIAIEDSAALKAGSHPNQVGGE